MDSKSQYQIPSFLEYYNSKKEEQELNEDTANINVEVPFWDEAVSSITDEIIDLGGYANKWKNIVNYCKNKYLILGKETPDDKSLVHEHIRELLYQRYGQSLVNGEETTGLSYPRTTIGTKILVINQLADEILRTVQEKIGLHDETIWQEDAETKSSVATVRMYDSECDNDLWEKRMIQKFEDFVKGSNVEMKKGDKTHKKEHVLESQTPDNKEQVEKFKNNKSKRKELIDALTKIEHPKAVDLSSEVGSAFDELDIEQELGKEFYDAYEAIGDGGIIYSEFSHTYWIRKDGELVRII